jgi:UDP-hydrolysing UDP-N-acetyl-D-glucosamine 2-epimerase
MKKICVCVMSRANYGRLKSVINAIKEHPSLTLQLIVGCSALSLDIEADYRIQCLINGDDTEAMVLTTGVLMTKITDAFKALKPDVVLIHGDRYEMLAVATAASYMNIPLAHTEGGEDTGTIDDKVRYAISSMADIHFPVTEQAAKKLEAFAKGQIDVVGSTALDNLVGLDLTNNRKEPYIVILHHPNTTEPEDITELIKAINKIECKKVWVNPNVDAGSKEMLKQIHKLDVEFVKDLPPEEYARLIYNCKCLIGNTSSGIKEGAFLGVPYVCIGKRQNKREHGINVLFTSYDCNDIINAYEFISTAPIKRSSKFGDGTAAKKIVEVLCSYLG